MTVARLIAAGLTATVLAGCAGYDYENLDAIQPQNGTEFTRALTSEYKALADFEGNTEKDWLDAEHYADKAKLAAAGDVVLPDEVGARDIAQDKAGEISEARSNLVAILDRSARSKMPGTAATAQAKLDCWMEQQEEGHQEDHIQRCRQGFRTAYQKLRAGMQDQKSEPEPEPEPEADMKDKWTVTFGFDSARVEEQARGILSKAVKAAKANPELDVTVTGYTDTVGPEDYNQELSLRRAQNVRDVLVNMGIDEDRIGVAARGESRPAIERGDGVRERANRRVVIQLF
jgi:OOP family OmpA-OmpF porin